MNNAINENTAVVFTDGACKGNPGPGGWGVVAFFPSLSKLGQIQVQESGNHEMATTNNRMELRAILEALKMLPEGIPCRVYSDSRYALSALNEYLPRWRRSGWKGSTGEPIANIDMWEAIDAAIQARKNQKLSWHHVYGHSGHPGNERADKIAQAFATGQGTDLFSGPLTAYTFNPYQMPDPSLTVAAKKMKPWYLSLIDGKLEKHRTWSECEERVKGHKNARFRKVVDQEQERQILNDWKIAY